MPHFRMLLYESFWVKKKSYINIHLIVNCYIVTSTFHVSRFCTILHGMSFMNQLQAYSHFWQTLLPCMSHSFWVHRPELWCSWASCLLIALVGAYEGHTLLAKITHKRRTHAANHGVCWLHKAKWWNYKKGNKLSFRRAGSCIQNRGIHFDQWSVWQLKIDVCWAYLIKTNAFLPYCNTTTLTNITNSVT